jgi:hypothetical protein
MLPLSHSSSSFTVTPVFFNVGINEMATLAESLGNTRPQDKSNLDNYERVIEYYYRFRKLHLPSDPPGQRGKMLHIVYILSSFLIVVWLCQAAASVTEQNVVDSCGGLHRHLLPWFRKCFVDLISCHLNPYKGEMGSMLTHLRYEKLMHFIWKL